MPQTLWAPWRMEYLLSNDKPDGCIFCAAAASTDETQHEHLVLTAREHSYVIINKYPYTHGHIMVIPKRHVASLSELQPEERLCLFNLTSEAQIALEKTLGCQGMNLGMNLGKCGGAGIEEHIHVHLVPRWEGDTNFMPLLADTRVMPEHLLETFNRLKGAFEALP